MLTLGKVCTAWRACVRAAWAAWIRAMVLVVWYWPSEGLPGVTALGKAMFSSAAGEPTRVSEVSPPVLS